MGYQSKVTLKGQTTLPIEVRKHLRLKPGDKISYVIDDEGVRLVAKTRSALDLVGFLGAPPNGPASLEEIDETIGRALAEDDERITREWNAMKKAQN